MIRCTQSRDRNTSLWLANGYQDRTSLSASCSDFYGMTRVHDCWDSHVGYSEVVNAAWIAGSAHYCIVDSGVTKRQHCWRKRSVICVWVDLWFVVCQRQYSTICIRYQVLFPLVYGRVLSTFLIKHQSNKRISIGGREPGGVRRIRTGTNNKPKCSFNVLVILAKSKGSFRISSNFVLGQLSLKNWKVRESIQKVLLYSS